MSADALASRDLAHLVAAVSQGHRPKYLYFWGHKPEPDGSIGKGSLSQWWAAPFTVDGRTYRTAEHWMMWSKAVLFADRAKADEILLSGHPNQAKALGRQVRGFDQEIWERERFGIVVQGSVHKYTAYPELRDYLLGTTGRVLVEASPLDRVWGIGLAADDPKAGDPARWRGLNLLGFALIQAREQL